MKYLIWFGALTALMGVIFLLGLNVHGIFMVLFFVLGAFGFPLTPVIAMILDDDFKKAKRERETY